MAEARFYAPDLIRAQVGSSFTLAGREANHAAGPLRLKVGETVSVTDGQGRTATGDITSISKNQVVMLIQQIHEEPKPNIEITLIQALAKGNRDELAIQAATELGAMGIIPWQSERSVALWRPDKAEKGRERWQSIVLEASKQSLRSFIPEVDTVVDSKELAAITSQFDLVLILNPSSSKSLNGIELAGLTRIALVVGPEGGISPSEIELLEKAGAISVHLGRSILRTSTAGMAAISYLQAAAGDWD